MTDLRRLAFLFVLICLGCSAQSGSPDVSLRIERQVRTYYSIPPDVTIAVSPRKASEFPNYDTVTVTFKSAEKTHDYEFLLSQGRQDSDSHDQARSHQGPLRGGYAEN